MNDPGAPRLARDMWKRFALATSVVVALTAAATATAGLLEVRDYASALSEGGRKTALKIPQLTAAQAGAPQTILLVGSDVRVADRRRGLRGNSDTMILVRLDPNKQATAVLSIPRDLKVRIRRNGRTSVAKINAAYAEGGPRLLVQTIRDTMPGIEVNHVVNVNFKGFKRAVNYIGCVYADIDRRYFNDDPSYAAIDVQPGYQKICGQDALDYARYRHTDTDLVRAARQQDFLRQAKEQLGVQRIIADRKAFAAIFGRYTETDIRGTNEILALFKLVAFSAGHPIREVHFRTNVGPSFVTSTPRQIQASVNEFLNARDTGGTRGTLASTPAERLAARRRKKLPTVGSLGLENAKTQGEDQAMAAAPHVRFPVLFPRLRTIGSVYSDVPRTYVVRDYRGRPHQAYRMVIKKGVFGEYYGVQGMTWKDAPIVQNPDEIRTIGGRKFDLYYDGTRLRLVALRTPNAVYYVSNTLLLSVGNKQMLAIAGSLQRIGE